MYELRDLLQIGIACRTGAIADERVGDVARRAEAHAGGGDLLDDLVGEGFLTAKARERVAAMAGEALAGQGGRLVTDLVVVERAIGGARIDLVTFLLALVNPSLRTDGSLSLGRILVRAGCLGESDLAALRAEVEALPVPCAACGAARRLAEAAAAPCPVCGTAAAGEGLLRAIPAAGRSAAVAPVALAPAPGLHDQETRALPESAAPAGRASGRVRAETGAEAPRVYGDYEIVSRIGSGGMGTVYRARHREIGRVVALKVLAGGEHASDQAIQRFKREAAAASRLQHPNIVSVYHFGVADGCPYLTMEMVDGESLADHLKRGDLALRQALKIVHKAALALHHAHEQGIVHRDVKPQNILVDRAGEPRLVDFGLAKSVEAEGTDGKITRTGDVLGTLDYMAPEQLFGEQEIDRRADVYAVGVIIYQILTGDVPYHGKSYFERAAKVFHEDPRPPSRLNVKVHRDIETICLKALERDRGARYPTAKDLADDLDRFLGGEPISARPLGRMERAIRTVRRHRLPFALVAGALLALAAFGAWRVVAAYRQARHQAAVAARVGEAIAAAEAAPRDLVRQAREALDRGDAETAGRSADGALAHATPETFRAAVAAALDALWVAGDEREALLATLPAPDPGVRAEAYAVRAAAAQSLGVPDAALRDRVAAYRTAPVSESGLRCLMALGEVLLARGDGARAYTIFGRAASRLPRGPARGDALERAGDALLLLGRARAARSAYLLASEEAAPGETARDERLRRSTVLAHVGEVLPLPEAPAGALPAYRGWKMGAADWDGDGRDELVYSGAGGVVVCGLDGDRWTVRGRLPAPEGCGLAGLQVADADGDGERELFLVWAGPGGAGRYEVRRMRGGRIEEPVLRVENLPSPLSAAAVDVDGDAVPEIFAGFGGMAGRQAVMLRRQGSGFQPLPFYPPANEPGSDVEQIFPVRLDGEHPSLALVAGPWNHFEILIYDFPRGVPALSHRLRLGPISAAGPAALPGEAREQILLRNDPTQEFAIPAVFGPGLERLQRGGVYVLRRDEAGAFESHPLFLDPDLPFDRAGGGAMGIADLGAVGPFVVTFSFEAPIEGGGVRRYVDLIPWSPGSEGEPPPPIRIRTDAASDLDRVARIDTPEETVAGCDVIGGDFDGDGRQDALIAGTLGDRVTGWIVGPPDPRPEEPLDPDASQTEAVSGYALALETGRDLLYLGLPAEAAESFEQVAAIAPSSAEEASALLAAASARAEAGDRERAIDLCERAARRDPFLAGRAWLQAARLQADAEDWDACARALSRIAVDVPLGPEERSDLERLRRRVEEGRAAACVFEATFGGPTPLAPFAVEDPVRAHLGVRELVLGLDMSRPPPVRAAFAYDGGPFALEATFRLEVIDWSLGFFIALETIPRDAPDAGIAAGGVKIEWNVRGGGSPETFQRRCLFDEWAGGRRASAERHLPGFPPEGYDVTIRYAPEERRLDAEIGPHDAPPDDARRLRIALPLERLLPAGRYVLSLGANEEVRSPNGSIFGEAIVSRVRLIADPGVLRPLAREEVWPASARRLAAADLFATGHPDEAWAIYREILDAGGADLATALYASLARWAAEGGDDAFSRLEPFRAATPELLGHAIACRAGMLPPTVRAALGAWLVGSMPPAVLAGTAQDALRARDPGTAIVLLERLRAVDPGDREADLVRGQALQDLGRYDEADEAFGPAAAAGNLPAALAVAEGRYLRARYQDPRDFGPALAIWREALRLASSRRDVPPDLVARIQRRIDDVEGEVRRAGGRGSGE